MAETNVLAPNGKEYDEEDINSYNRSQATSYLSKLAKYTDEVKVIEYAPEIAPNGQHYEAFDIAVLMSGGSTRQQAIEFLNTLDKYLTLDDPITYAPEIAPNGKHYEEDDISLLTTNGMNRDEAIEYLKSINKYSLPDPTPEPLDSNVDGSVIYTEPLFLPPDGVTTRFPIGWNGIGRYVPGSLEVKDKDNNSLIIIEEDNGIWYSFSSAPLAETSYTDYTVSFKVREIDRTFSLGLTSEYSNEEYFLFPNWLEKEDLRYGFWVGKYIASNENDIPVSKKLSIPWTNHDSSDFSQLCKSKGERFHVGTNDEWCNIAYWTDLMHLNIKGNSFGYSDENLNTRAKLSLGYDGDKTQVDSNYILQNDHYKTLTGAGPDTWRHNHRSDGIADLVGNVWEYVDNARSSGNQIYINNLIVESSNLSSSNKTKIKSLVKNTYDGVPLYFRETGYIARNIDGGLYWIENTGRGILLRGGSCSSGHFAGIWAFNIGNTQDHKAWHCGFRVYRSLEEE